METNTISCIGTFFSQYLFSFNVCKNRTYVVGNQNQDFVQNAYLMIMPAETWATTKVKNAKHYAVVHRNVLVYTEN